MFNWAYDTTTKQFLFGGPYEVTALAGQLVVALSRSPNPRTERFDAQVGTRPATAQEISDFDAAQSTAQAAGRFDDETLIKALAIWAAQKLGVPLAIARAEILTIYRGL